MKVPNKMKSAPCWLFELIANSPRAVLVYPSSSLTPIGRIMMDRRCRCLFVLAALFLGISPSGSALSIDSPAGPAIPWWEQVVRAGIALEVDMAPLDGRGEGLKEREQVAFRFRLFDVATG